jgi:hypothetical protein
MSTRATNAKLTFPPCSHHISAWDLLTTLLLNATFPDDKSPPPPAIVSVGPPIPVPALSVLPPASGCPAGVRSVNLPIFRSNAGALPLTSGPTEVTVAAATEGCWPA